jgi:hypothetical protein
MFRAETCAGAADPPRRNLASLDRENNQGSREQGHGQKQRVVAPAGNIRKHFKNSCFFGKASPHTGGTPPEMGAHTCISSSKKSELGRKTRIPGGVSGNLGG